MSLPGRHAQLLTHDEGAEGVQWSDARALRACMPAQDSWQRSKCEFARPGSFNAGHQGRHCMVCDLMHVPVQAWGCLEFRRGCLDEARRLFQSGVWADPASKAVTTVWQASFTYLAKECHAGLAGNLHPRWKHV